MGAMQEGLEVSPGLVVKVLSPLVLGTCSLQKQGNHRSGWTVCEPGDPVASPSLSLPHWGVLGRSVDPPGS